MNHYPHHIGDFNNATRHSTVVERAFYRELIELYYATEKPIPAGDFEWIAKRCLARSDDEKAALKAVLGEFFKLEKGVYKNNRCDAEILIYKDKIEKAQKAGRISALTRAKQTLSTRSTPVQRTSNQPEPEPEPEPVKSKTLSGKPDVHKQTAIEILNFLNAKTGRHYKPVKVNLGFIVARLKAGATETELRQVIAKKTREWQGNPVMDEYLRPATLFNDTKFNQYVGELLQTPEALDAMP